jgi:hypothetical protein
MSRSIGLLAGLIAVAGSALAGKPATDPQGDFIDLSLAATPPAGISSPPAAACLRR